MKKEEQIQFAICLDNEGYRASLEVGKLYQIIPDNDADIHGYISRTYAKAIFYFTIYTKFCYDPNYGKM